MRSFLIVVLTLGAAAGFGFGFMHAREHRHARWEAHERHIADVCVQAARRTLETRGSPADNGGSPTP
ncbi:MAG TPA: hypothetical protein VFH51_17485 [Myxococcota bacterium]|nr:hypothetical protein [Myxococcota bacterium]